MASSNAVWGIDIGHCALKALCCRSNDDGTLVAEAFDYIEYPKLLTQPDANPEQLIKEALQQFLSNNNVRGGKVGISVSGQSGLARFIKLPPVEAKKIPDIVKYEAKQQIPFPLEDVIWDYQRLGGGMQDDGLALETEVGLFAMKRDQVFRALRPFRDAGIELDVVQLTPIAIYNAVTYSVMDGIPDQADFDPDNPPESAVIISMGTDTTDLVITNGFKIWQRSIPIGGSHFTKQLMKEMKLTFAKAEHLKRNARDADDPKAVFQAMRPVFNDMVQELQRSIGFFRSIDRSANITKGVVLGNTVRLPGLQPYLEKNLDIPFKKVSQYDKLSGSSVVSTPKFKDNILSFAVSYGLCLQGLSKSRLSTNLIPRELITARIIRHKKPWAVAALALLMIGFCFNYMFNWNRWRESHLEHYTQHSSSLQGLTTQSSGLLQKDQEQITRFNELRDHGIAVVGGADRRFLVLELLTAINSTLPFETDRDYNEISKLDYTRRPELHIEYIESQYFPDLASYATGNVKARYKDFIVFLQDQQNRETANSTPATTEPADETEGDEEVEEGDEEFDAYADEEGPDVEMAEVSGPGWVVEIGGFHFHSHDVNNDRDQYLRSTILSALDNGQVTIPRGANLPPETFTMKELGIQLPILAREGNYVTLQVPDPDYKPPKAVAGSVGGSGEENVGSLRSRQASETAGLKPVQAWKFTVQFIWVETLASQRWEKKLEQQKQNADGTADELAGR